MARAATLMEILTGNPLSLWLPLARIRLSSGPDVGQRWAPAGPELKQMRVRGGCFRAGFFRAAFTQILDMEILCNFLLTVVRLQKENTALKMDKT